MLRRSAFIHLRKSVEQTYEKMTPREHILSRPDMYVGTLQRQEEGQWVWNEKRGKMVWHECRYIPGMYKIFDEILVNAADNKARDPKGQTYVDVQVNEETGQIVVKNDGAGIPVAKHKTYDLWVPEMIFGHLLTSSNYDDKEERTTGGRYGYGAKLTNIFSKKFTVETQHKGKRFSLTWQDNMGTMAKPVISPGQGGPDYTSITFLPDYERLGMPTGLASGDISDIIKRRVIDLAGIVDGLEVYWNGVKFPCKNFREYCALYPASGEGNVYERINDHMEVCLRSSEDGFQHVSFVNSIATVKGGSHVHNVADQVVAVVKEAVKKRDKSLDVTSENVKAHLWVFVNQKVNNPSFDSQTKSALRTRVEDFGRKSTTLPQNLIDKFLEQSNIVDIVVKAASDKYTRTLGKTQKGRIHGIPKLEDAAFAGDPVRGKECTLILTEGDSAKSLAVSGLGTLGREKFGVFPLRGKMMNVRSASMKAVASNEEVKNVMDILGMKPGETDRGNLRYGHVMIMADQDTDGIHIKGLISNMFQVLCPKLFQTPGFLSQFITPIVKAFKGKEVRSFYSVEDFKKFSSIKENTGWQYKYYKGLGTSNAAEAKEYFASMQKHKIDFVYKDEKCDKSFALAFDKDHVDDRKKWITQYHTDILSREQINLKVPQVSFQDFIHKDLIQFSLADCMRSIPHMLDGMKPGQRKTLFACFKRSLSTTSLKVAQLAGYIAEHTAYHHGEVSLHGTIVNLAQNYVGSNNLAMLVPDGQFGTRLQGGKDHASARYIFTKLDPLARMIFPKSDEENLKIVEDDGEPVEPVSYVPVIPMVLVNGSQGIGTGFASTMPNYNPLDLIECLRQLLKKQPMSRIKPWYRGFTGSVTEKLSENIISTTGVYEVYANQYRVNVTDLPVGEWTSKYKTFLDGLVELQYILSYREFHSDTQVDFDIYFKAGVFEFLHANDGFEEILNLSQKLMSPNMTLLDEKGCLREFKNVKEVLEIFYTVRLHQYDLRIKSELVQLKKERQIFKNKLSFIQEVTTRKIDLLKPRAEVEISLKKNGYQVHPKEGDYEYLFGLKVSQFTRESVDALEKEISKNAKATKKLEESTAKDLWEEDLAELEKAILKLPGYESRQGDKNPDLTKEEASKKKERAKRPAPKLRFGGKSDQIDDLVKYLRKRKPAGWTPVVTTSETDGSELEGEEAKN